MPLSNLNPLTEQEYFDQLYAIIKIRENNGLQNNGGQPLIHNGGGDGNPTFGYGFNLNVFGPAEVEGAIRYAFTGSTTGALTTDQEFGLSLVLAWKNQTDVIFGGQTVKLTKQNIIDMARNTFGDPDQRAAVQSLSLNDVEATRLLDVAIKGAGEIVHIEGPVDSFGYEAGFDSRLSQEGGVAWSVERVGIMSAYYNAIGLVGAGLQAAIGADDRGKAWYELRYNHQNYIDNAAQTRRAEESEQLGLVSQTAKDDPAAHVNDYAKSLSTLFNDDDNSNDRIYTRILDRDEHDDFNTAIADELLTLRQHLIEPLIGAANALDIDWVQFDATNGGSTIAANDAAAAGVVGGKDAANTVNLIMGEAGNDSLTGKGATDYLFGGVGNDTLAGDGAGLNASTAGDDFLHGGAGIDSVDYSTEGGTANPTFEVGDITVGAPTAVGEPTLLVTDTYGHADTLVSIEWLIAPGGDDAIDLDGFTGSIGIDGGGGDDSLNGGSGNDSLFGGEGFDSVSGGAGNDLLGNIHGPAFDYSSLSQSEIDATFDSEQLDQSIQVLSGGAGADGYLIDYSEAYAIAKEAASSTLYFVGVGIDDSAGDSSVFVRRIDTGQIESLSGSVHTIDNGFLNYIVTEIGTVYWIGLWGDDTLLTEIDDFALWVTSGGELGLGHFFVSIPSGAPNGFAGAPASDFGISTTSGGPVLIASGGVTSSTVNVVTTVSGTSAADILHAQGGQQILFLSGGNDQANTGDSDDQVNGEAGADTLDGGAGNDTLDGGAGADSLIGNDGVDYASYASSTAGVTIDFLSGISSGDIYVGIEGVIGSSFRDIMIGDASSNLFDGGAGNDNIDTADGNDFIIGGSGRDTIMGGAGQDSVDGSAGDDSLDGGGDGDNLFGGTGYDFLTGNNGNDILSGGAENDTLSGGKGFDYLLGDDGNDSLLGDDLADTLSGGNGSDFLNGGIDNDLLYGDAQHDLIFGDAGDDFVDAGTGNDTVDGGGQRDSVFGGSGFDMIDGGGGNDTLTGGTDGDTVNGAAGFDVLQGDDGDDILNGGASNDVIFGNAGNDTIVFELGGAIDTLRDFTAGSATTDVVRLVGFGASFETFAAVIAAATDNGADTTIDFGNGDVLIIRGVLVSQLHTNDFIFG